jgi:hypothetical protein
MPSITTVTCTNIPPDFSIPVSNVHQPLICVLGGISGIIYEWSSFIYMIQLLLRCQTCPKSWMFSAIDGHEPAGVRIPECCNVPSSIREATTTPRFKHLGLTATSLEARLGMVEGKSWITWPNGRSVLNRYAVGSQRRHVTQQSNCRGPTVSIVPRYPKSRLARYTSF